MLCVTVQDIHCFREGVIHMGKSTKGEMIAVRVPEELKRQIEDDAAASGWGVSEQIRFELMYLRGKWKGPRLPKQPAGQGETT